MKKRLFAIIAVLLLVFSAACENVEYIEPVEQSEESLGIYDELESQLPALNDGETAVESQDFKIITDKTSVFINDETNPGSVNSAIIERNAFLKSKYGANLRVAEVASNKVSDGLKNAYESGLDYCDMLAISARETVKLFSAGLLTDMNTLPDFNPENEFFDKNNATSLATNNTFYMLADPTAMVYEEMYVLFYNRNLVTEVGGVNPEKLVMQGKWTWDAFNEAAKLSAAAVYNKTSADLKNDIFAFGAYYLEGTYPLVMWTSSGEKLIDNTYKNPVALSMEMDDIVTVAKSMMDSYNSRGKYPLSGNSASDAFQNGRLAFLSNKFEYLYALRDGTTKGSNYGMLPMPKYSETQERYNCLVSSDARVFSVPKTVDDDDADHKRFVSAVISATCASGNNTVPRAFLNHHIGFYLNNNDEAVVMSMILDSLTFDFANVYGSGISEIRLATTAAIVDYLDVGSGLVNSINYAKARFDSYCQTNFNQTS